MPTSTRTSYQRGRLSETGLAGSIGEGNTNSPEVMAK